MKTALASVAALFVMTGVASANITVTGQGKIKYTPDIAHVTVTASSDARTAAEAWQQNSVIVQRMFDVLKSLGIDEKDFKTAGVRVTPRYEHPKDKAPVLVGYTVSYDLTITVRDLKKLGTLLDQLVDAGANRGMGITFAMANPESLLDQARAAAVADARKKADIFVKGAGGQLGGVLTIVEGNALQHKQLYYEHLATPTSGGKSSLPIAAGQQELEVTVTVTYAIHNNLVSNRE
jgi:uncharacterized protein YggE